MLILRICLTALIATMVAVPAAAAPAAGDTYVYRVLNGYNKELRGTVSYRVDKAEANRVEMSVATDAPALGTARTEIYTNDGNWLRHVLTNHDQLVNYEFSPAFPAYVYPLEPGKSWSVRVSAVDSATGRRNSVRVDGKVLGNERVTTPAGAFDSIKVRRDVYAGDWDSFLRETHTIETDWYAPALGRPVRMESKSEWQDMSRCSKGGCPWFHSDWNVSDLAEIRPAKP